MNLDYNGKPTKYLITGLVSLLLIVVGNDNNDWSLVPQTLASLWFIFTFLFTMHEVYLRLTYYFRFKTFSEGGINSNKELILNFFFLIIFFVIFF